VWQSDQNGTVAQVNLPASCASSGQLVINFMPSTVPVADPVT